VLVNAGGMAAVVALRAEVGAVWWKVDARAETVANGRLINR